MAPSFKDLTRAWVANNLHGISVKGGTVKTLKYVALCVVAIALLASCTTFKASGLSFSTKAPKATVLGDFRVEVWVNEFLGTSAGANLFNITADATEGPVKDAIQNAIKEKNGDAAVNVTIEHQASVVDILLNVITSSIYAPGNVIISGTIVKYE